jgi:hypothetical protein
MVHQKYVWLFVLRYLMKFSVLIVNSVCLIDYLHDYIKTIGT